MLSFLQALIGPIFATIDKIVVNKAEAEKIKQALQQEMMTTQAAALKAAADIIVAEAKGESWLQRNWRPLLMLWFAGLIGAHWLGFTAPNLSENVVQSLLDIVQLGVGGYIIGRSAEKIVKQGAEAYKDSPARPLRQRSFNN